MAYDQELADRIRLILGPQPGLTEQRMFGGLAFLVNGHMAVSASGQGGLLLRHDPARTDELAARPGVDPFVMRGRPMQGWLRVGADAVDEDEHLREWIDVGVGYARSLPPKR